MNRFILIIIKSFIYLEIYFKNSYLGLKIIELFL